MSTPKVFALIDCNNFFVSCVRVFKPDLEGKPCVALSSNDGCAVARSNEAKALGIPMGAPAFKWRQFFKDNGVVQFSGNFELYGDMSRRITSILTTITPRIEIYSVDESFLDLSELNISDYTAWGRMVRETLLQWTGIPVSIGIAPSKTLAKLASSYAKKHQECEGVLHLDPSRQSLEEDAEQGAGEQRTEAYMQYGEGAAEPGTQLSASSTNRVAGSAGQQVGAVQVLSAMPVEDVWGVGWRLAPRLKAEGINSAYKLSQLRPQLAQSMMGIHGRQMVAELNGTSCIPLQTASKPAKSIANTRTFGQDTNQFHVLEAAISSFAAKTTHSLRKSQQLTRRAGIFIATNRHKPGYRMQTKELVFATPTADTGYVTAALIQLLTTMFNSDNFYHRAGVWLHDFIPEGALQTDILDTVNPGQHDKSSSRMQAIDVLNKRYGKHTIYYASEDLGRSWQPIRKIQMPRFTTRWDELPKAKVR